MSHSQSNTEEKFFPIRVEALMAEVELPFSIYLKIANRMILYAQAPAVLTHEQIQKLQTRAHNRVFLPESDRWQWRLFMQNWVQSGQLTTSQKAHFVRQSALSFIEEMFSHENVHHMLDQSLPLVENFIVLMEKEPEVLAEVVTLSAHDFYTFNHSLNVAIYTLALAHHLNWEKWQLIDAAMGGLFHDIGKRLVPFELLNKKGKLDPSEWAIIRNHPQWGLELLIEKPGVSEGILAACFEHHESFNGTGYPRGIKADEIHPIGRLVAIADTFDALTSQRSYNQPLSVTEALDLMINKLPGRFDPTVMEILKKIAAAFRPARQIA